MELDYGHVATDAVAGLVGVAGDALFVIEGGVVALCIHVRGVTGGAGEFAGCEAAAFKESQGLEAHVFGLCVVHRGSDAMAGSAEIDLFSRGHFSWVGDGCLFQCVLFCAGVAAFALHASDHWFSG